MNKKLKNLLLIIGGGIAAYFLIFFTPVHKVAADFTEAVLGPPVAFTSQVFGRVNEFFLSLFSLSSLERDNKELELQVAELEGKTAQINELKKENDDLKAQLSFQQNFPDFSLVEANIIARDPSGFSHSVTIDRGLSDGLAKEGVVVFGGYLVGKIKEIYASYAVVELIVSPGLSVPAIESDGRAQGIVRGSFGFGLALEEVDQSEQLKEGKIVVTSGIGGVFPRGLILGTIVKIENSKNKIFQSANLKGLDLAKLERVFVLK